MMYVRAAGRGGGVQFRMIDAAAAAAAVPPKVLVFPHSRRHAIKNFSSDAMFWMELCRILSFRIREPRSQRIIGIVPRLRECAPPRPEEARRRESRRLRPTF